MYHTVNIGSDANHKDSVLKTVYEDGDILIDETFEIIRKRALI